MVVSPRFSVGKTAPDHPASPVGATEICAPETATRVECVYMVR